MRGTYGDKEKKKEKKKKAQEQAANANKKPTVSGDASTRKRNYKLIWPRNVLIKEKAGQVSKFK